MNRFWLIVGDINLIRPNLAMVIMPRMELSADKQAMRCHAVIAIALTLIHASESVHEALNEETIPEPVLVEDNGASVVNAEIALGLITARDLHTLVAASTYFSAFKRTESPLIKALLHHASNNADIYLEAIDDGPSHDQKAASGVLENLTVVHTCPVEHLRKYPKQIDFLLLDTADEDYMQLKTLMVAYSRLHSKSMVMADGCELGRCNLVELYLKELGWMTVLNDKQLLLIPGENTLI